MAWSVASLTGPLVNRSCAHPVDGFNEQPNIRSLFNLCFSDVLMERIVAPLCFPGGLVYGKWGLFKSSEQYHNADHLK